MCNLRSAGFREHCPNECVRLQNVVCLGLIYCALHCVVACLPASIVNESYRKLLVVQPRYAPGCLNQLLSHDCREHLLQAQTTVKS